MSIACPFSEYEVITLLSRVDDELLMADYAEQGAITSTSPKGPW